MVQSWTKVPILRVSNPFIGKNNVPNLCYDFHGIGSMTKNHIIAICQYYSYDIPIVKSHYCWLNATFIPVCLIGRWKKTPRLVGLNFPLLSPLRQAPAVFNVASLVYLSCPLMELAAAAWETEMGCGAVVGWVLLFMFYEYVTLWPVGYITRE